MRYCKKCVMPDTRPGISFDKEGICSACINYEKKKEIDWKKRWEELKKLCDKYRGSNGDGYDCIIAVSGGKDSHFQTHIMKEKMGMNPLLVTAEDNMTMTKAGIHNLRNISEVFGCDIISFKPNIAAQKRIMRMMFEKYGKPTWYVDRLIYTYPLHMAVRFNIPLVVYGENISYEYGGDQKDETPSARDQIYNGVAVGVPMKELAATGVDEKELFMLNAPSKEEINKLNPVYLSYFVPWNSYKNFIFAKSVGFHDLTHEWDREHCAENFDQVDTMGYIVHAWMKYPKFGHASATDYSARLIRYGLLTREQAIQIVKERDHKLDQLSMRDFCSFLGYTEREFWKIVDKFYNKDLFEKDEYERWVLKSPIWKQK